MCKTLVRASLIAFGLLTAATPSFADPSLLATMAPDKTGSFSVGALNFSILHKSDKWANTLQSSMVANAGFPQSTPTSFSTKGSFKTPSGGYALSETVQQTTADSVTYDATLTGAPTAPTNVLCLCVDLPVDTYKAQAIYFDSAKTVLPWWFKSEGLAQIKSVKSLRIPLRDQRTLIVNGDFSAYLQDVRAYGSEHYNLQIGFSPSKGSITESHLQLALASVGPTDPNAVAFDPNAQKPSRPVAPAQAAQKDVTDVAVATSMRAQVGKLTALHPQGEDFVDPTGKPVRFWGMNLVAFYPDHATADATADNLAQLGVNLVRPHHDLRQSLDWNPANVASLLTYQADSRTPNLEAWDRYDYLNAKLRQKGIYLGMSIHGTRSYLPYDAGILKVSPADDEAWADAIDELNHWPWQKSFDPRKMLPVVDERCFLLNAEYATSYLKHVNPYTGLAYGNDSQTVSLEMINEFSTEYTLVCHNTLPAYFTAKLNARLAEYCKAKGIAPFELYAARTPEQVKCFSQFCNDLDRAYTVRMTKVVRDAGYQSAVEFSNLWRGDANLRLRVQTGGVIEDHDYDDPLTTQSQDKMLYSSSRSAVAGKPIIIGEFNQAESPKMFDQRKDVYPAITADAAVYASLQNYAGIVWFAWAHGIRDTGTDGWGKGDMRTPGFPGIIGSLNRTGPVLDHLRAAGIIYKNRYLSASTSPVTITVSDSYYPNGYNALMSGETAYQPGWQIVHGFRKTFSAGPAPPLTAPWLAGPPADPAVSDTGQISRNIARRQLSFAAPKCEGFAGYLDGKPADRVAVLSVAGDSGFATVLVVALDDLPLATSHKLLVSKTYTDAAGAESASCPVSLAGVAKGPWSLRVTRPTPVAGVALAHDATGALALPIGPWNECELELK